MSTSARYYQRLDDGKVRCTLCPKYCIIGSDSYGFCKSRINIDGELIVLNYAKVVSANIDPIEKKPLYHFKPNTEILSIGSFGCNMSCSFCQNHAISQNVIDVKDFTSIDLIEYAKTKNIPSIAFTYNEPVIYFEYMLDTAILAKDNNIATVVVTNGMIEQEPLKELLPYIDAMNVDLKAFNDNIYKTLGGNLSSIKNSIETIAKNTHLELTFLAVTGLNCNLDDFYQMIEYIASIDKNIPLHISRYFPAYKYDALPTDIDLLMKMYKIATKSLSYVYLGNCNTADLSNTYCPSCGEVVIKRSGYNTDTITNDTRCIKCSSELNILF